MRYNNDMIMQFLILLVFFMSRFSGFCYWIENISSWIRVFCFVLEYKYHPYILDANSSFDFLQAGHFASVGNTKNLLSSVCLCEWIWKNYPIWENHFFQLIRMYLFRDLMSFLYYV